ALGEAAGRDEAALDVHVDVDHPGLHVGAAQVDRLPGLDLAAPRAVALLDLDEAPAQHGEPAPEHRLGDDVDDVRARDEQVAVRAADVRAGRPCPAGREPAAAHRAPCRRSTASIAMAIVLASTSR